MVLESSVHPGGSLALGLECQVWYECMREESSSLHGWEAKREQEAVVSLAFSRASP